MMTREKNVRRGGPPCRTVEVRRSLGLIALSLAPLAGGCGSIADAPAVGTTTGVAAEAIAGADCGYSVVAKIHGVSRRGFHAKVKVSNVSGLASKGFTVLVRAGEATLVRVARGTFERVEGGYLLSPVECIASHPLDQGDAYEFELAFEGKYTELTPIILSNNGTHCDQEAPAIQLTTSGSFFTSDGTLRLTAEASDNVAVGKVVFSQDGVELGVDTSAPYQLDVPIASALNGRHQFEATAYDLTGNRTSQTKRALVAIGNKFFGMAATTAADYAGLLAHFNQITPGNAGKWGSVEGTRDQMNWTELDTAYHFAKDNHIPFKLHTLVWGSQQPGWLNSLSAEQQLVEIEQWMTALAERYPDVELIDVVNEPLHAPPSYAAALGGAGTTGWDWVIKAFEMARAHFPKAELLLNDYSILTMSSSTESYLNIVRLLQDRDLIDGIGEQGHFYERSPELAVLSTNLASLAATGLPVYITELDLNFADDARQANRMKELFTTFWSNPSVLGVTHWGYIQGNMWQTNAYLVRTDGTPRPALAWIDCYRGGGTDCTVPAYVPQPHTGALQGITLEAEEYDSAQGLLTAGSVVAYANDGSWLGFDKVTFQDNWNTLQITYAEGATTGISLSIHLDSLDSAAVATVSLPPTGGWGTMKTVSIPWAPLGTQRNVLVRFHDGGANIDKIQFAAPSGTGKNLVADSDFELGTSGGWWSWSAGTIANTTARAVSGTHALAMTGRTGNSPLVQSLTSLVVPGKTYKASLWATVGGAASANAFVTTVTQCANGTAQYNRLGGWDNSKTLTDGAWVEFAGDITVPDCTLTNVGMWLEGPDANVDLYVDHASVRQQSSSNALANGTFESGTSGWYTWGGASLATTTARAHGGTQTLLVANRTGNSPATTDLTNVVSAGTSYPFDLWVSIATTDASSKAINVTQATTCKAADGTTSTTYSWVGGPITLSGGSDWAWTQISGVVAVPNCTVAQLQLMVEGGEGADLYLDDVRVVDNSLAGNLITDGTFESSQGAWTGWSYTSLAVVNTTAHSGTQSLLAAGLQQNGAVARDIKAMVAPGKRYQASAWVSVGGIDAGAGSVKWQTVLSCNGIGTDSYPWLAGATVASGTWQQVVGTIDLTACTSVEKLLLFAGADAGDLYLDDATLTALP